MSTDHWDDPAITNYVMNEMSDTEKQQFEARLANDESLVEAVEQARQVLGKLESYYEQLPPQTLPPESIASLTQAAASEQPQVAPKSQTTWTSRLVQLAIVASLIGVLAVLVLPANQAAREVAKVSTSEPLPLEKASEQVRAEADSIKQRMRENGIDELAESAMDTSKPTGESAPARDSQLAAMPAPQASASVPPASGPAPAKLEQEFRQPGNRQASDKAISGMMLGDVEMDAVMEREAKAKADTPFSPAPSAPASVIGNGPMLSKSPVVDRDRLSSSRLLAESEVAKARAAKPIELKLADESHPFGGNAELPTDTLQLPALPGFGGDTDQGTGPDFSGDRFEPIDENEFRRVSEHPLSTFSIDVDTASYAKVRSFLRQNRLPRPDAVRIEELINYFDYSYDAPPIQDENEQPAPFTAGLDMTTCPWNPDHKLVRVGIQAKDLKAKERPRCNLVFLIDTSGSMQRANKLPLVIDGMKLLLDELNPKDQVSIVVYAGSAGLVLEPTPVKKKKQIVRALSALRAGGSTNGGAGLQLAYNTAREAFVKDGVNRVILCSDGDFNVGMTGTDELVREARRQAKSGIDLTVLGFGMGNHNDAMMEKISNDAEGNYGFIDTLAEARKVLADQLSGTLVTVAKDVKIQIEFHPANVTGYRLIGYENRMLAKEDFNDDKKDAGEIGAGHRVTALYEIVPSGVDLPVVAPKVDPLKYQPKPQDPASDESNQPIEDDSTTSTSKEEVQWDNTDEMLTLKLRYKPPQGTKSTLATTTLKKDARSFEEGDEDLRFAAAVASFGMQLRQSRFVGSWTMDEVIRAAEQSKGDDSHGLRAEFIELARQARELITHE